ncbi:50S ribosomal protein L7/L12 [Diplonema papillatum]|nr:50S ribosomal protein L7/L12 [Diplonema papillatum]
MLSSRMLRTVRAAATRPAFAVSARTYCEPPKEVPKSGEPSKEVQRSDEDELTAHFRLPNKGDGPEKVVYDLAEKVLSLNVLQFRLFQKIVNEAMGKSEMWEYDLVMNLSKALAGGGGGGGGFMMQPGMMQQAAPTQQAAPAATDAAEEEKEPEKPVEEVKAKTEFDVKLTQIDPANKVKAIKVLKDVLKMGLKDGKDKVENLPSIIATGTSKDDAENLKAKLAEVGASATIV